MLKTKTDKIIEDFSHLSLGDKEYVTDILQKQLVKAKREAITKRGKEALQNIKDRKVKTGTVEGNGFYCGGGWNPKEKRCSMVIETGRNINTAINYSIKLRKWFEVKKINFQLTSTVCDNWYT